MLNLLMLETHKTNLSKQQQRQLLHLPGDCWAPFSPSTSQPSSWSWSLTWPTTSNPSSLRLSSLSIWLSCWYIVYCIWTLLHVIYDLRSWQQCSSLCPRIFLRPPTSRWSTSGWFSILWSHSLRWPPSSIFNLMAKLFEGTTWCFIFSISTYTKFIWGNDLDVD